MAMKPRAMKRGGAANKIMRGGKTDKPVGMKRGGAANKMMRGGKTSKKK